MSNTVLTRKDMKEPDKFQVVAGQAATWLASRKRHLVLAAGAVVAVIALLGVVQAVQQSKEREAGAAVNAMIDAISGEISATPVPGFPGQVFPDDASRQKAVVAAADRVISGYAGSKAASLAQLSKGDAQVKLGEWDAAKTTYEQYLGTAKDDSLRFGALQGLALAAEGKGDFDAAAKGWDRLGTELPKFSDRADLEKARVLARAGKVEDARGLLKSFGEKHKDSILGAEATDRLARLGQ